MSIEETTNLSVIKAAYAAFGRGDIDAVIAMFTDHATICSVGDPALYPVHGVYEGAAGIGQFFQNVAATFAVLEFVPGQFEVFANKVLVHGHERIRMHGSGREVTARWLHLITLDGGKMTALEEWTDGAALLSAHRDL